MRTPNEIKQDEITARHNRRNRIVGTSIGAILFFTAFILVILTLIK